MSTIPASRRVVIMVVISGGIIPLLRAPQWRGNSQPIVASLPRMRVQTYTDRAATSRAAAAAAARAIRAAIDARGDARIVVATGASQIDFLDALVVTPGIDWRRVEL